MNFRPLSVRRGIKEPFTLQPGIPAHIKVPLLEWTQAFFWTEYGDLQTGNLDSVITRLQWPIAVGSPHGRLDAIRHKIDRDDDAFLDLLDLLCLAASHQQLQTLETILESGLSEWRVRREEPAGLEERLTIQSRAAFEMAVSRRDAAAEHIADAWGRAFGRHQEAGAAWHSAVKAVEALLHPLVEPNNQRATLGSMVAALRAKPEKWTFLLASGDGEYTAEAFLRALQIVGYEPGRHGTDPSRATIEQARVVVLQAVTLVEWLRAGALKVK